MEKTVLFHSIKKGEICIPPITKLFLSHIKLFADRLCKGLLFLTLPMSKVRGFLLPADCLSAGLFISDRPQCKVWVCHYPS